MYQLLPVGTTFATMEEISFRKCWPLPSDCIRRKLHCKKLMLRWQVVFELPVSRMIFACLNPAWNHIFNINKSWISDIGPFTNHFISYFFGHMSTSAKHSVQQVTLSIFNLGSVAPRGRYNAKKRDWNVNKLFLTWSPRLPELAWSKRPQLSLNSSSTIFKMRPTYKKILQDQKYSIQHHHHLACKR